MVIERIDSPADVKQLARNEIDDAGKRDSRAARSRRARSTAAILRPNLGVVELTLALHRVLDLPHDKLVWDVSHQTYVHKILTGRRDRFATIRKGGGLSGFAMRSESRVRSVRCRPRQHGGRGRARHGDARAISPAATKPSSR